MAGFIVLLAMKIKLKVMYMRGGKVPPNKACS